MPGLSPGYAGLRMLYQALHTRPHEAPFVDLGKAENRGLLSRLTQPEFDLSQPVFPLKIFRQDFQLFPWMGIGRFRHFLNLSFWFPLMIFLRKEIKMEKEKAGWKSRQKGQDASNRLFMIRYRRSKSCFSK